MVGRLRITGDGLVDGAASAAACEEDAGERCRRRWRRAAAWSASSMSICSSLQSSLQNAASPLRVARAHTGESVSTRGRAITKTPAHRTPWRHGPWGACVDATNGTRKEELGGRN